MNYSSTVGNAGRLNHSDFWDKFNEYARADGRFLNVFQSLHNCKESRYEFTIGQNCTHIALTRYLRNNNILIEFHTYDKELFDRLYQRRDIIEYQLDLILQWRRMDDRRKTTICYKKIFYNNDTFEYIFDWLIENAIKFKEVFSTHAELDTYNRLITAR